MSVHFPRHDKRLGDVDGQHDGQNNPPNLQHESREGRQHKQKVVVQQTAWPEIRSSRQQKVDQHALRKVEQVAQLDVRRNVPSDSDVAPTQNLERVLVHLDESLSGLTQRLHRWIESNGACLTATTELHLVQVYVCHLRRMAPLGTNRSIGFDIAANLMNMSVHILLYCTQYATTYRIVMVCIHVLDDPLLGCHILCLWSSHFAGRSGFRYRDNSGAMSDVVLIDWSEVSCGVTSACERGCSRADGKALRDPRVTLVRTCILARYNAR